MKKIQIQPYKAYTMKEIVDGGLLLNSDGKPYVSVNMVRRVLVEVMGYSPVMLPNRRQLGWQVLGSDIIAYNEKTKNTV